MAARLDVSLLKRRRIFRVDFRLAAGSRQSAISEAAVDVLPVLNLVPRHVDDDAIRRLTLTDVAGSWRSRDRRAEVD